MNTSIISSQGQTTIPSAIRKHLSLTPGKPLSWEPATDPMGIKYLKVYPSGIDYLLSLRGIAKKHAKKYGSAINQLRQDRKSWDKKLHNRST